MTVRVVLTPEMDRAAAHRGSETRSRRLEFLSHTRMELISGKVPSLILIRRYDLILVPRVVLVALNNEFLIDIRN